MTKTFNISGAQGDVYLRRITAIPANAKPATPDHRGFYVVAHSETGHDHVIDATPNVQLFDTEDPLVSYLRVIAATEETEALLKHLRGHDTHETIAIGPGDYELRRQREYVREGYRRAQD